MTAKERMLAGEIYQAWDAELVAERARAHALCRQFNEAVGSPPHARIGILRELLGRCPEQVLIEPGLRCDYGYNIFLGDNFYANFDLIILDIMPVRIGKNCMLGPRVSIFTAAHPLDAEKRVAGWEFGKPVTIGDNVWIGGGAIINPGVTIGDNAVVGSGSVVTRNVPANSVAVGNPARPLKKL